MKYIKKLIRNSKRALNQQVIKKKQEIVKYAPRLTGIQARMPFRLGERNYLEKPFLASRFPRGVPFSPTALTCPFGVLPFFTVEAQGRLFALPFFSA